MSQKSIEEIKEELEKELKKTKEMLTALVTVGFTLIGILIVLLLRWKKFKSKILILGENIKWKKKKDVINVLKK